MVELPDGWRIQRLKDLAQVERGKFTARPRNDPKLYGGEIPFVQTGDIRLASGWLKNYSQTLNEEGLAVSRLFPAGTILLTIAANIGDVAITLFPVACPDSIVAIQTYSDVSNIWLMYALQSHKLDFDSLATQNAQKNINLEILRPFQIVTPPPYEQRKIAAILSTWDEAITLTGRLVDALKRRKQALMQLLLTGEVRFTEFDEEWESLELGSFVVRIKDQIDPTQANVDLRCIELEHIEPETGRLLGYTSLKGQKSIKNLFSANQILFGKLRPYLRKYAQPDFDGATSSEVWVLSGKKDVSSNDYLFYIVQSDAFIGAANATSGTKMPRADWKYMTEFVFDIPQLEEQEKIASVLAHADEQIKILSQCAEELQTQKRGLMQQLLTGTVRVQVDET